MESGAVVDLVGGLITTDKGLIHTRSYTDCAVPARSGPRIVDSVLSEISTGFQAAVFTATCSKYTASGVRRSSAV